MESKNRAGKFAVIAFVTMTAASMGALFLFKNASLPTTSPIPIINTIGGEFELPSTLGKPIKLSDFQGKVIMLNFGYTSCPDICPMVLTRLAKISKALKVTRGFDKSKLQTFFISTDPERDDVNHLQQYLDNFHPDFVGLSGSAASTKKVAQQYGVYYQKEEFTSTSTAPDTPTYDMAHTDRIFLLDKIGRLRKLYSEADSNSDIIKDIRGLIAERHTH